LSEVSYLVFWKELRFTGRFVRRRYINGYARENERAGKQSEKIFHFHIPPENIILCRYYISRRAKKTSFFGAGEIYFATVLFAARIIFALCAFAFAGETECFFIARIIRLFSLNGIFFSLEFFVTEMAFIFSIALESVYTSGDSSEKITLSEEKMIMLYMGGGAILSRSSICASAMMLRSLFIIGLSKSVSW
jgi:hypothetical protein